MRKLREFRYILIGIKLLAFNISIYQFYVNGAFISHLGNLQPSMTLYILLLMNASGMNHLFY